MAASPLPRWAPTPSPTRPLRTLGTPSTGAAAAAASSSSSSSWRSCMPLLTTFSSVFGSSAARRGGGLSGGEPPALPPDAGRHDTVGGIAHLDGVEAAVERRRKDEMMMSATTACSRGVFLTWDDLSVTAPAAAAGCGGHGRRAVILDGLSGYARPGEVLALMGPSGCGKTTLLDALAGRLSPNMKMRGDILMNGLREKLSFGTSAYVTQENVLMATLTVTEAVHYSAQLQLPDSMPAADKRALADRAIRQMGLGAVAGVRIGGRVCKGISGGQRKRVSICVELLASPSLLFLDEPTSGLDSAASYHVMSRIAGLARRDGMTVVAAVHQPSTEMFELFRGLCLLATGRTVYFGAASDALEFFESNGFPCPLRRNPSDHFLRMINKDFEESEEGSTIISPRAAEVIQKLMGSFKSCGTLRTEKEACAMINQGASPIPQRQATFLTKTYVLTKRSIVNMHRDAGYYWLRFVIYIAICLSIGTIFFNVGSNFASIQARASMLMFTSTLLTMMAIGGFPSFVEDMKIFRKERMSGHYGATEFVISNTLSSIPYLGLISIIPGAIAYYLTGLQRGIDHFIYFAAVLWACTMLVEGLMMIVAAVVPDFLLGIITGSGVQGVLMLNAGFFRLPSDLPKPVWKYPTYFISYHKYATQGLYKNELLGLVFDDIGGGGLTISGEYILKNYLQVELSYSKWVDLAILVAMIIIYRVLFLVIIKISEIVKPRMLHFLCASKV
uniref:ABC transporter domain-containing protein n=1 Tax=Oryza rufipogon TaxID=4529 RepID=A0A0E0Q6R8_ORYRU